MRYDLKLAGISHSGTESIQVVPLASSRPLVSEREDPQPSDPTPESARETPVVDYGFTDDINRRIEINYDPNSARYKIPKYLRRITDTLFSRATPKEIFMVQMNNISKQRSKKWKSKNKLNAIPQNQRVFKRAFQIGIPGALSLGNFNKNETIIKNEDIAPEEVINMEPAQILPKKSSKQTVVLHKKTNTLKLGKEHSRTESNRLEIENGEPMPLPAIEIKAKNSEPREEVSANDWVLSQLKDVTKI
jgi:hypothetical protein